VIVDQGLVTEQATRFVSIEFPKLVNPSKVAYGYAIKKGIISVKEPWKYPIDEFDEYLGDNNLIGAHDLEDYHVGPSGIAPEVFTLFSQEQIREYQLRTDRSIVKMTLPTWKYDPPLLYMVGWDVEQVWEFTRACERTRPNWDPELLWKWVFEFLNEEPPAWNGDPEYGPLTKDEAEHEDDVRELMNQPVPALIEILGAGYYGVPPPLHTDEYDYYYSESRFNTVVERVASQTRCTTEVVASGLSKYRPEHVYVDAATMIQEVTGEVSSDGPDLFGSDVSDDEAQLLMDDIADMGW